MVGGRMGLELEGEVTAEYTRSGGPQGQMGVGVLEGDG